MATKAALAKMKPRKNGLTQKQLDFCINYIRTGDPTQSALAAGYSPKTATSIGNENLLRPSINAKIRELMPAVEAERSVKIASAQEVMEYFTKVMNGEILDQFGLEAPLSERTKAAVELAKRTVDMENRMNGKSDAEIKVKLDWDMN